MGEPQGEYRIQPLRRMAKIYEFPTLSRFEVDELTYEQKQAMREEQALAALRSKARLELNTHLPWYRRAVQWYDRNYEQLFEGTGAAIAFLAGALIITTVFYNLGRSVGWWGM